MGFLDFFLQFVPIVHRSQQVSQAIRIKLLWIGGHPTLSRPCEEVHGSISLMCSSILLEQCPACHVCLISMVFDMGGWLVAVQLLFCGMLPPRFCSIQEYLIACK